MKQFWINSFSNPNKEYIVRFFPETDKFACECPNYLIKHTDCKHIGEAKKIYFDGKMCGRCKNIKCGSAFWPNQKWCIDCFSVYRKQIRVSKKILLAGFALTYTGEGKNVDN